MDDVDEEPDQEVADASPVEEMSSADAVVLLGSVPERVADIVSGLTAAQLGYRHGPAFPTAGEIAGHLALAGIAFDELVTAVALQGAGARPSLHAALEAPIPAEPAPVAEKLEDWQRHRRRAMDLVRGQDPGAWERPAGDERTGELSLLEACRLALRHELGHLSQLRNLSALLPVR